jgi:hypothetical protein
MGQLYQGRYHVKNPEKYKGNVHDVIFRSSWEYRAMIFCDMTPAIKYWSSEETVIPYISPLDGRRHRYFMDLTIWTQQEDGTLKCCLVEIKPYDQTQPPKKKQGKRNDRFAQEVATYSVNQAKWEYARAFCEKNGYNFIIWTEKELLPDINENVKELKSQRQYEEKMKKAFRKKKDPKLQILARHLELRVKKNFINDKNKV